jgi:[acyl-carrier-protein] S-malonyltransferase
MITRGSDYLDLLVGQVANSVRWDLCMASMVEAGVSAVIEVSPAGTLMGLAKRSMPGIEIVALKEPKDLEAAQELLNRHTKKA